ncbi:glycosyltransferase family 2 protein [Pseudoalteromonas viridis]|uniref:Glycosyltransferase family 2 protein n=1 Tax=Pseudoalteromonas viridis TaxID=339617 RepID=A0ABX7V5E8_9GAMM|nr:glycosyltransferase family 2 protein [Pseudoalteromonas viridis]QTL36103.1 glycosyltransferase family 2 protein [Pseudoalteromonas viridis]
MTNKPSPLVSVLIPAYNCSDTVEQAVNSVLNQSYSHIEIVIVNDCSVDDTATKLSELEAKNEKVSVYKNEQNLGYLRTFNKLLSLASGEYITFLDSDDWIAATKIEKQVKFLSANHEYGFCGTGYSRTDSKGRVYQEVILPEGNDEIQASLNDKIEVCFCGSSVMVKRDVIECIGGYNEYFLGCPAEDYDWIRRMANKYKGYNLPETLYFYRFSEHSLTRNVQYDIKAQSAAEIAKLFDEQRRKYGQDALSNPSYLTELESFIKLKQDERDKFPHKLVKSKVINSAIQGELGRTSKHLLELFKMSPANAFVTMGVAITVLLIPNDVLLRVKVKLGKKFRGRAGRVRRKP